MAYWDQQRMVVQEIHSACKASDTSWSIDFDNVWPLFHRYRKSGISNLRNLLEEGIDFMVERGGVTSTGLSPSKYYLSEDAFKMFALAGHGPHGRQVRKYYIELEKSYMQLSGEQALEPNLEPSIQDARDILAQRQTEVSQLQSYVQIKENEHVSDAAAKEAEAAEREAQRTAHEAQRTAHEHRARVVELRQEGQRVWGSLHNKTKRSPVQPAALGLEAHAPDLVEEVETEQLEQNVESEREEGIPQEEALESEREEEILEEEALEQSVESEREEEALEKSNGASPDAVCNQPGTPALVFGGQGTPLRKRRSEASRSRPRWASGLVEGGPLSTEVQAEVAILGKRKQAVHEEPQSDGERASIKRSCPSTFRREPLSTFTEADELLTNGSGPYWNENSARIGSWTFDCLQLASCYDNAPRQEQANLRKLIAPVIAQRGYRLESKFVSGKSLDKRLVLLHDNVEWVNQDGTYRYWGEAGRGSEKAAEMQAVLAARRLSGPGLNVANALRLLHDMGGVMVSKLDPLAELILEAAEHGKKGRMMYVFDCANGERAPVMAFPCGACGSAPVPQSSSGFGRSGVM